VREEGGVREGERVGERGGGRVDPAASQPSVEALLHALLPHRAVLHSHADVIAALTNVANGERVAREVFGDSAVAVRYVIPGFDLAREVRRTWRECAGDCTLAIVLLHHGLVTFGATSQEAYERHLAMIDAAT